VPYENVKAYYQTPCVQQKIWDTISFKKGEKFLLPLEKGGGPCTVLVQGGEGFKKVISKS